MGHLRLPLLALLGAVGCTRQDAAVPEGPPPPEPIPRGNEQGPDTSIRPVSPEERQKLFPTPSVPTPSVPTPQDTTVQAAPTPPPAPSILPVGTRTGPLSPEYAEQRRQDDERTFGKGSGIRKPRERIQVIRSGADAGTPVRSVRH